LHSMIQLFSTLRVILAWMKWGMKLASTFISIESFGKTEAQFSLTQE
jgi:hypothetical protein